MHKYICLDTETGGLTLDTSLLTAYFGVLDENLVVVDELYLYLKPDDGVYKATAEALNINKINLIEHDNKAIPYKASKTLLYNFLSKNYKGDKLIPIGHGLAFDLPRIKLHLIGTDSWEQYVSYRTLDTGITTQFLRAAGMFPNDVTGSLGSLVKYFNIDSKGDLHDAKVDALQTVAVLKELFKIVQIVKRN